MLFYKQQYLLDIYIIPIHSKLAFLKYFPFPTLRIGL